MPVCGFAMILDQAPAKIRRRFELRGKSIDSRMFGQEPDSGTVPQIGIKPRLGRYRCTPQYVIAGQR
jgi:hypothetical protein